MEGREEAVVLPLTQLAYNLIPAVEPGVATSGTWDRKGNTKVRITCKSISCDSLLVALGSIENSNRNQYTICCICILQQARKHSLVSNYYSFYT